MTRLFTIALLGVFAGSCQPEAKRENQNFSMVKEIASPCKEGGEPNLFVTDDGQIFLSWIEYENDTTDVLRFSKLEEESWSSPKTIAKGTDWFVNWADFPSLVTYPGADNTMAVHWLQKSGSGTFDYDVRVAQSIDGGEHWQPSFVIHSDGIPAEHGFVSLVPIANNRIFATWLDGRNTKNGGHNHDEGGHGHGEMTLRAATFDPEGELFDEVELDDRVCECCQTSAALTDEGVVVVYRNRSEDEIRDIGIVRQVNGRWTEPGLLYEDSWKIAGCPVNGPSITAEGKNVVVAWFSIPNGEPEIKVVFSEDSGKNFSAPIKIDEGDPLGRVDVLMLSEEVALVSWMEMADEEAVIKAIKVNQSGRVGESFEIANVSASRRSGFPRMVKRGDDILFAWTQAKPVVTVKTAKLF